MRQASPRYLENDPTAWEGGDFPTNPTPLWIAMGLAGARFSKPSKAPTTPKVWYRGTPHTDRLLHQQELTPEGLKGTYFTSDPKYAAGYGPVRGYTVNGSIKDVYLPDPDLSKGADAFEAWDAAHDAELTRAHGEGHAGVRLWEQGPGGKDWEEREMILFDPKNAIPHNEPQR